MTPMTPMLGSKLRQGSRCNLIPMLSRTLAFLLVALLAVAGCGGDDEAADSSTDVDQLLKETFEGGKSIESGKISLTLDASSEGDDQPLLVKVSGPFQSEGAGRLPQLDIDASLEGGGQSMSGGITTTADQAFVTIEGSTYEVSGPVFEQFKAGYEESAKQSTDENQSLASLGIDPRRWLTNARNEGESQVGDTETIKITGDVDVPKLLDDVNAALEKVRSLGVQGSDQIPEKLTDEEKRETAEAIQELSVEIHTGADDRILRRIVVTMSVVPPEDGAGVVDLKFDLQLLDVNEDQEIEAPADAKPFEDLLQQLEGLGLGDLGALGGAAGGGGAAAPNVDEYSECVRDAGSDNEKVRKCADLLTTP
jgi:hypothetical protein